MKKSYSSQNIIQLLREKEKTATMNAEANARIRNHVLASLGAVTETDAHRYNHMPENILTQLFLKKPMIALIILTVMIAGGTGTAIAANNALPGDALYGVDRALEQTQLHFALSSTAKAKLYVKIAEEREQEIEDLQEQNRPADQEVGEEHEQQALQNAQTVITRVLEEHQEKEQSGKSVEALTKVQQKLEDLSQRFEERRNEDEDSSSTEEESEDDNPGASNSSNGRSEGADNDRANSDNQEENDEDGDNEIEINAGIEVNTRSNDD